VLTAWLIVVALLGATPTIAPPQGGSSQSTSSRGDVEIWYGGSSLAIDAAATGLVIGGFALGGNAERPLGIVGVSAAVLVPPFNHLWNGHRARLDTSAALRAGAAVVGVAADVYLATKFEECSGETHVQRCGAWEATALLAPLIVAMVIDDAFLSRAPPVVERGTAAHGFTPMLELAETRALVGVTGAF
jgi:hypothetical protein